MSDEDAEVARDAMDEWDRRHNLLVRFISYLRERREHDRV